MSTHSALTVPSASAGVMRPSNNRFACLGTLTFSILTEGGQGILPNVVIVLARARLSLLRYSVVRSAEIVAVKTGFQLLCGVNGGLLIKPAVEDETDDDAELKD